MRPTDEAMRSERQPAGLNDSGVAWAGAGVSSTVSAEGADAHTSAMKILLVEDSPVYRHLISGHLKEWDFDPTVATNGEEAWTLLQAPDAPRLVLLDWVLPKIAGVELCRRIRRAEAHSRYTYAVLLTGKDAKADLLEGMQAGADDYLVKPFDPPELRVRLLAGKRILDLQHELVETRESLRIAATYDSLTGLLNRGEILAFLNRELARGRRGQSSVGIILADLDHFKSVNDSHGHPCGDAVLRETAKRLKAGLRVYDGAGRYGGEEFLLVLPGCDLATTVERAEQIRKGLSATEIKIRDRSLRVTTSMGVALAASDGDINAGELLLQADTALYRAKSNGRDRIEIYLPPPPPKL
jgi:two-component system cell cycle response regulator